MDIRQIPAIDRAFLWLEQKNGSKFLTSEEHCQMRDIFEARLDRMERTIEKRNDFKEIFLLLIAIAGELGNNAFDHNVGNWRDEPGIFFAYDLEKRFFVIADRGQGVLKTLQHARLDLRTESDAVHVAFTESLSGRAPEHRGNGLKFVRGTVMKEKFDLTFQSGNGVYLIKKGEEQGVGPEKNHLNGVIAVLFY